MRRHSHPWGTPPWTIDFRPSKHTLPERVDFAVVGAGFAGLSAAAWLARLGKGKSVLVLESECIGNGASGRTGGLVLDETAAGPLPGLGNVLAGYRRILRTLKIEANLALPGAWELARSKPLKNSPIFWNDSGLLRAVGKVRGGSVDAGKIVAGLARAVERGGAQISEHAEVLEAIPTAGVGARDCDQCIMLRVRVKSSATKQEKSILAGQVLLATNAGSLGLSGWASTGEPRLTLALATAPLTGGQLKSLGLTSRGAFYTVDFPYLWGRMLENKGVIFGSGLLPRPASAKSPFEHHRTPRHPRLTFGDLLHFDVNRGATRGCLDWLESRVRGLHPVLKNVRITHRWGGPILFTKDFYPVFRPHPEAKRILTLGGFCGHGVALSVYLGHQAAQVLLGLRPLPRWVQSRHR